MDNDFYEIINLLSNWKSNQRKKIDNFENRLDSVESSVSQIYSKYSETLDLISNIKKEFDKMKKEFDTNMTLVTQLEQENTYLKGIIEKENK